MRSILGKLFLAPALMAAAAFTATTAKADTTVKVPFSFTVAGKSCPAGYYTVKQDLIHNMVTLQSNNAPRTFSWFLNPADDVASPSRVTLRFNELGEAHSLQSVQYGSRVTSRLDKKTGRTEHAHTQIVQGQ
jgi:hypothetical protein